MRTTQENTMEKEQIRVFNKKRATANDMFYIAHTLDLNFFWKEDLKEVESFKKAKHKFFIFKPTNKQRQMNYLGTLIYFSNNLKSVKSFLLEYKKEQERKAREKYIKKNLAKRALALETSNKQDITKPKKHYQPSLF